MIVTVTLNPALHVRYDADRVELARRTGSAGFGMTPAAAGWQLPGCCTRSGTTSSPPGWQADRSGELIRNELAKAGVATQFTRISAESRRVVRVADASAGLLMTSFEEPAPYITTEELGRLAADYRALLDGATAVVLCGSLPAGLPAEIYGSLTSYADRGRGAGHPGRRR